MRTKAVFIDKDGTLIPDIPYNIDVSLITLNENVVEGLQLLQSYGYRLIVVSNQDGIAKGYFSTVELQEVRKTIRRICSSYGIYLDGFYYCPHHLEGTVEAYRLVCDCRKPQPGLLFKAAGEMNIDLSQSWMIGDILNDVEAGNRAGCKSILIDNGNETEWVMNDQRTPEYRAKDITQAARYILADVPLIASNEKQLV